MFSSKPNEDLIGYCGRFEALLAKFDAVAYVVPEDQKFHFFVKNLNEKMREFSYTWRMCNVSGKIEELISAAKARFHMEIMLAETSASQALLTVTPKKKKGKQGRVE